MELYTWDTTKIFVIRICSFRGFCYDTSRSNVHCSSSSSSTLKAAMVQSQPPSILFSIAYNFFRNIDPFPCVRHSNLVPFLLRPVPFWFPPQRVFCSVNRSTYTSRSARPVRFKRLHNIFPSEKFLYFRCVRTAPSFSRFSSILSNFVLVLRRGRPHACALRSY